jgi:hypothetical protein
MNDPNPTAQPASNPGVVSSEMFDALVRTVNKRRYRGPDGRGPMTEKYHWPLDGQDTEAICNAALRYVVATEKASNDQAQARRATDV